MIENLKEPLPPWSEDWKKLKLLELYEAWSSCEKCELYKHRTKIVYGAGNPCADILIVGEAPGVQEDLKGEPFVGPSGTVLHELLAAAGIEDYFLTNTVMCHPPENRDPSSAEKKACIERLYREIYIVDPLVIIAVGKEAFQTLAGGRAQAVSKQHGETFPCVIPGIKLDITYDVMPTYHPAYVLRFDKQYTTGAKKGQWKPGGLADDVYKDLKSIKTRIDNLKRHYAVVQEKYGATNENRTRQDSY